MRVNQGINQANSSAIQGSDVTGANSAKKSEKIKTSVYDSKASGSASKSDSVKADISSKAHEMAQAKQIATDAPDVREAKVAALRDQIKNKTYNVSSEAIADKLVNDHLELPGA